jgi:hypothetical protein
MRLTLKQAREALYDAVVPNVDTDENVAKFTKIINLATERLINGGKWQGTLRKVRFIVGSNGQTFTLPRQLVAPLAVKFTRQGWTWPGRIQNVWYTFLPYTENLQNCNLWSGWGYGTGNFDDDGDGYPVTFDSPFIYYKVRAVLTDSSDVGKALYFKADGVTGQPIYSMIDGETAESVKLVLANPHTTSVQVCSGQIKFVNKELTTGYVYLDYVETDASGVETGNTFRGGYYEPGEETIALRRYRAFAGFNLTYLDAICKVRYVAARTDEDEIIPANLGALRNAMAGIKYEMANDPGRRDEAFGTAYALLNQELKESLGGDQFHLRIDPASYGLNNCWFGV